MKNPFPGMNPYLEGHWPDVHSSLIIYTRDQLQEKLPEGLLARAEEQVCVDEVGQRFHSRPDVQVSPLQPLVNQMLRARTVLDNGLPSRSGAAVGPAGCAVAGRTAAESWAANRNST